jgi:hypothetical protein
LGKSYQAPGRRRALVKESACPSVCRGVFYQLSAVTRSASPKNGAGGQSVDLVTTVIV